MGRGHVPCVFDCVCGCLWCSQGWWGPRGLCRHQDGAIQVAASVTLRLGPWSVSTSLHSLDALAELVDSRGLLALSTAPVFYLDFIC